MRWSVSVASSLNKFEIAQQRKWIMMSKRGKLSRKRIPEQHRAQFDMLCREADHLFATIRVLHGVLQTVKDGDPALMEQLAGDAMWISSEQPANAQLGWAHSLLHALSILKPLCVELYLKALIYTESKAPLERHNLAYLYGMLGYTNREDIKECLPVSFDVAAKDCGLDEESVRSTRKTDVGKILEFHRNDFVGLRYGQETAEARNERLEDMQLNLTAVMHALNAVCDLRKIRSSPGPRSIDRFA